MVSAEPMQSGFPFKSITHTSVKVLVKRLKIAPVTKLMKNPKFISCIFAPFLKLLVL